VINNKNDQIKKPCPAAAAEREKLVYCSHFEDTHTTNNCGALKWIHTHQILRKIIHEQIRTQSDTNYKFCGMKILKLYVPAVFGRI